MGTNRKRIKWSSQPFGQLSDAQLAGRLGVSQRVVRIARERYERCETARATAQSPSEECVSDLDICRDDRCNREGIHPVHRIHRMAKDPFYDDDYDQVQRHRHSKALRDVVMRHVTTRRCKPFRELLDDVRNDYGEADWLHRALHRALNQLRRAGKVVNITMQGDGVSMPGGYVRGDSPLLRDADGMVFLRETLDSSLPVSW